MLPEYLNPRLLFTMLLTGAAYFIGAWFAVHHTITPEGIAILWPPNAILLPVLLMLPPRQWPFIALAALVAEVSADIGAFPLWAALAFGCVNLFEVLLAAVLIRRGVGEHFSFDKLSSALYFLLCGPILASGLAALPGASIYVLLGRNDTSFITLWQLWWFGDALGLLLLVPLIVVLWRKFETGMQLRWLPAVEAVLIWIAVVLLGRYVFSRAEPDGLEFHFTPEMLLPLGILAAVRLGVLGATSTVLVIAGLAVGHLVRGIHPYAETLPQYAVLLTQEYLVLVVLVSVGLAILLREINDQRALLNARQLELQQANKKLEERVQERTVMLELSNAALERANQKLQDIAATDELTGISSRRFFRLEAQRELNRLGREGKVATVIMLDLDHFKQVNDTWGHEAGDVVLRIIQEPIRQSIRPRDLQGRIGGEEFLILLSGIEQSAALVIAERIRKAIENKIIRYHEHVITITASLGVAQWDGHSDLDELIRQADTAMYQAKHKGRNRVEPAA